MTKTFAAAMNIHINDLNKGVEFVIASKVVEHPLGFTKQKNIFTLSRGTSNECEASVFVTVDGTIAYGALLGMEFITAIGGDHDTYSEMFKYRWERSYGPTHGTKSRRLATWRLLLLLPTLVLKALSAMKRRCTTSQERILTFNSRR